MRLQYILFRTALEIISFIQREYYVIEYNAAGGGGSGSGIPSSMLFVRGATELAVVVSFLIFLMAMHIHFEFE